MRKPPRWSVAEQGSDLWLRERLGCLTASRMGDALDRLKSGAEGAKRKALKIAIVAERIADSLVDRYVTEDMKWGQIMESAAIERYEEVTGVLVSKCGFALHGDIELFGASPDRIVSIEGLVEAKCPRTETYISWRAEGVIPEQHKPQMLAQLAVTGRKWVDFVAFDPRVKARELQIFIRRFKPPEADIAAVEKEAVAFLAEVDELFDRITRTVTVEEKEIA